MPPWDRYSTGTATVSPDGLPAFIPPAPNPRQQRADARADEDQQMQREAAVRADAAAARAQATADRVQQTAERTAATQAASEGRAAQKFEWEAQDRAAGGSGAKATEAQTKSAQFLGRMLLAEREFQAVPEGERDPRTVTGQAFREWAPGLENMFNSGGRQRADQAVENFIAASLRQESGAAIGQDEFRRQYAIFFPQPGDGTDVLAQKARARLQAIEGFKAAAGPLADAAVKTAGSLDATAAPVDAPAATTSADSGVGGTTTDVDRKAAAMLNSGASLDEIDAFMVASGRDPIIGSEFEQAWRDDVAWRAENPNAEPLLPGVTGPNVAAKIAADAVELDAFGSGVIGVADTLTGGFLDEIAAAGDSVGGALAGNGSFSDLYDVNLAKNRAIIGRADEEHPWATNIGRIGGSALPAGALGRLAAGTRFTGTAFRAGVAGDAAYGALYGLGSGTTAGERTGGALAGFAFGGAGSAGVRRLSEVAAPAIGGALARFGRSPNAQGAAVARAAEAEGVSILPADVAGPGVRRATAVTAQMPLGARPIVKGAERTAETFDAATSRVANDIGTPLDPVDLGDTVRSGAERFSSRTSNIGGKLYDRADRMARGVKIKGQATTAELQSLVGELGEAGGANAPLVAELERVASGLFDDAGLILPKSVKALQDIRSAVRTMARNPDLRGTRATYAAGRLESALTRDIEGGLSAAGRDNAIGALRKADAYWRDRVQHIDEVLQPLLGRNRSGEDVAKAVTSLVQGRGGGVARLKGVMSSMTDDEANNFRATVVEGLGRPGPGAQGAQGEGFSVATFLTNWNKMTPRAKNLMFPSGAHRTSLDNLATVAAGVKDSGRYANTSNTGSVLGYLSVAGPGAFFAPGTTASASIGQMALGKALSSPRLVAILTKPARTAAQRSARMMELGRLSARYPALASPAHAIANALEASPSRAAAEGGEEQNGG